MNVSSRPAPSRGARRRCPSAVLAALVAAAPAACKKSAPEAPPAVATRLPPLDVKREGSWLFTYAEPAGTFATVDQAEAVPEASRRVVRVVDPGKSLKHRSDNTQVYVVDLNQLLSSGRVAAAAVSREAFETAALAQLPPGEHSAWPRATAPPPPAEEPSPGAPAAGAAPRGTAPGAAAAGGGAGAAPVVTIYGTSWCGACKAARSYLAERKVPFADKDIERDPAAAAELREKAARLGVPADRVPILDVRGRLLVGFDRARLEALLGQPS